MKKIVLLIVSFLLISLNSINVFAYSVSGLPTDEVYSLVDFAGDASIALESYNSYNQANAAYERNVDAYDNLGIVFNGVVYKAEYGIVQINATEACDVNVEFENSLTGGSNYVNGCYGADAAYISTTNNGNQVEFMLAGVRGKANFNDVTIIPLQQIPSTLSSYIVNNGHIYHQIKGSVEANFFSNLINLGISPSYLSEGNIYYSYDGHYFYTQDDLWKMLDDYKNEVYTQALNPEEPYYNYYQFVSHRTITNVSLQNMRDYFYDTLQIVNPIDTYNDMDKDSSDDTLNRSQFYDQLSTFYEYQYIYGSNALMMLSLSINESAFGRSSLSFTRNNLFGHAAYDSDVEKNASRYFDIASSIYSHAKYYISGSYSSPLKTQYHGSFFGNKSSGMNVSYASDPYWGEKASTFYLRLDEKVGSVDLNSYTLGIKTSTDSVDIYQSPEKNAKVLYSSGEMPDYSFTILESFSNEDGDWYKIQSDATLDEQLNVDLSYYYDFMNDFGYISQDSVQVILPSTSDQEKEFVHVTFDANGGSFVDGSSSITYEIAKGDEAAIDTPKKEGALFMEWDAPLSTIEQDITYTATYKDTSSIELIQTGKTQYEVNDRIDLSNTTIRVHYTDGESLDLPVTTSMVSGYDFTTAGDQEVLISFAGQTVSYGINVSQELDDIRVSLKEEIVSIIAEYDGLEELDENQTQRVLDLKTKMDSYMVPYLTQSQLRSIDHIIRLAIGKQVNYVINESALDPSISGLSTSIDLGDSLTKGWIKDTYKIIVSNGISLDCYEPIQKISDGNDYTFLDTFTISGKKNLVSFDIESPIIVSIKKPEDSTENQVYTVLKYENGDIVKCYTKQTEGYIQFMTSSFGEFALVSKSTSNVFDEVDFDENITIENSDIDIPGTIAMVSIVSMIALILILVGAVLYRSNRRAHKKEKSFLKEDIRKDEYPTFEETTQIHISDIKQYLEDEKKKND